MARSFVGTESRRRMKETNQDTITFTGMDNKTRLDFCILLVLCLIPRPGQSICSSKGTAGLTGEKMHYQRDTHMNHSGRTNTSQREVGFKSPVTSVFFWTHPLNPIYLKGNVLVLLKSSWDFPGGPVGRTPCFHCRGHGFYPWLGN